MSLPKEFVPVASDAFRSIPSDRRLPVINQFFVSEIEQLGYDLAHAAEPNVVAAMFIAAGDIEARLDQLQNQLKNQLAQ